MADANLQYAFLESCSLTGAVVVGASFRDTTQFGFSKEQLYDTASYSALDLSGIDLGDNDLTGWDLSGQNLTDADFRRSLLLNVSLDGAMIEGADFSQGMGIGTPGAALTRLQLESTASYQAKSLRGIGLGRSDLTGCDFSGQNLTNADLTSSTLTNADLTGANLRNANLFSGGLTSAKFSAESVYNQWTGFPEGFDPTAAGLTLAMSPTGDLDADDALGAADVDMLANKIGGRRNVVWWQVVELELWWLPDAAFDMNGDSVVSVEDHRAWVKDLRQTWFGDANLDGDFDSADLVQVFQAAKYEQGWVDEWNIIHGESAGWSEGDWNGDGVFDSADFITAFQDGGYELGPRTDIAAVPEPGGVLLLILGLASVMRRKTAAQNRV